MFTLGVVTSGLITSDSIEQGPLDENLAITGVALPKTVPSKMIEAIGFFTVLAYYLTNLPNVTPNLAVGNWRV